MLNDTEFSRKIYKELCEEFGDNFLEQPEESVFERAITAKDIVKYSSEEIDAIQKEYDKENCREIFQAYVEHRINQEEVLFLLNYYRDGMKAYREVYRGLYEIYGIPEQIACMNQLNGELEMHIQKIPHVDAKKNRIITVRENVVTNYSLKEVTPFTCMRLEYRDNENNPVYVILPVMKKARRAIEKIQDYRVEQMAEVRKINESFQQHGDIDRLQQELAGVRGHLDRVNDILRLTITRKYYTGVSKTRGTLTRAPNLGVNPAETRSLFYDNDMKNCVQLKKNGKNYYDDKLYLHLSLGGGREFKAEVQIKIDAFYRADLQTHLLYEEQRALEENLKASRKKMSAQEVQRAEYRIEILKKGIQKINKQANHEYNMMVLEKVRWLEDGYRALRIPPDYRDGTYKACHDLIKSCYMVRPHKIFDVEKEFDFRDKDNIAIAARGNYDLKSIYEISGRYRESISRKYSPLHDKIDVTGKDRTYPNFISAQKYDPRKDKSDWDGYGKARKFRVDMNRNIYRDNYERDYWQDYDAAENEVAKREKKLTRRQIRIYHKNVSKERAEIEVPLSNRSEGR
ncbi:MAG: hypothetical protein ACLU5H_00885 [Alphaproteobacteria bacterium]|jgi:hypothetical protein|nr:hypothetical protein [Alphaproteobacteria bacterium]MBP3514577.1 hypothetical protein [Alphaproteobacteria bacterium]